MLFTVMYESRESNVLPEVFCYDPSDKVPVISGGSPWALFQKPQI